MSSPRRASPTAGRAWIRPVCVETSRPIRSSRATPSPTCSATTACRWPLPAIDAGDNAAPQLPAADLDGAPRIADGNQDGDARVDIGAYEYHNQPPVANAGADQTVTADGNCRAVVALDGGASSDADGDPLTFTWTGPFGTVSGTTASVELPAGTHVITLTVRDGRGASSSDVLLVTVVDATPPAIAVGGGSAVGVVTGPPSVRRRHHQRVRVGRVWRIRPLPHHVGHEQRADRRRLDHHR